jgi:AcrR family transcriptional regulator
MSTHRLSRRQVQAEATRRDILAAARKLFALQGYAATSMAEIAEASGAVVQTVYDSVGPKRAVLLALTDLIDEEAGVGPMWREVGETEDPRALLALVAGLSRQFNDRCGDIVWTLVEAASIEPDVAEALHEGHRRHREGTRRVAMKLADMGALRPSITTDNAAVTISVLTWVDTFRNLVRLYGWSFDQCEAWLTDVLQTVLLRDLDDAVARGA